ncbi:MAG TPA: hypothetical protein VHC97_25460 [Thermoanaerobaculia bacterium]|jgi:hypothetical protein|nr:hypothetical protein [Thermoanaerobaculia bacterium]
MKKMSALVLAVTMVVLQTGCATSASHWEKAAVGAALADIASTGGAMSKPGFKEANPIYGPQPTSGKMLAVNAGVYAGVWALTRDLNPVQRQRLWRTVTVLRLLVVGWNLSKNGYSFSLRF